MKAYTEYYVQLPVTTIDPIEGVRSKQSGYILFGIRLQDLLINQQYLWRKLGFFTFDDIRASIAEPVSVPSVLSISDFHDACRLGLVREFSCILIPVDPAKFISPFHTKYNSTIPYDVAANVRKLRHDLYKSKFTLGENGETAEYKIMKGTIKEKKTILEKLQQSFQTNSNGFILKWEYFNMWPFFQGVLIFTIAREKVQHWFIPSRTLVFWSSDCPEEYQISPFK